MDIIGPLLSMENGNQFMVIVTNRSFKLKRAGRTFDTGWKHIASIFHKSGVVLDR